ncbi:MAG TPA: IPT/TIG domain-containing protein [Bryobacteraceae bacterium]|nr:IPT/TIG domain-containing protein [Bryobacteraceae bacterium]
MQRLFFLAFSALFILSSASSARAQSIQVGPASVTLTAPSGGTSQSVNVSAAVTSGTLAFTTSVNYAAGGGWLQVSPSSGTLTTTPIQISISANALALTPGSYTAYLVIAGPSGNPSNTVRVDLTVASGSGPQGTLGVSPTALSLSDTSGLSAYISVTGPASNPVMNFTATASTTTGSGWLQVSPVVTQTPASLLVTAITSGLANGTYQGSITITPTSGTPTTVPVTLTVGASSGGGTVSPSSFQFYGQPGGSIPPAQYLNIASAGAVTLTPTTTSGGNWLTVSQTTTATPATIAVTVNPSTLAAGTYFGNIAVALQSTAAVIANIPVTFSVGTGTLLTLGAAPAPFTYQSGGPLPPAQTVAVGSSSGTPLSFSVAVSTSTGVNWLAVSPTTGATPATLTVSVFPTNLPTGVYTGTVTVTASGAANSPQSFQVTLNVNNAAVVSGLQASPSALYFAYQIGGANPVTAQSVSITTPNTTSSITATPVTSTCGSSWLQVTSFATTTPTTLIVSINTAGLTAPQTCTGAINISAASLGATVQIPVTLTAATTPLLNVSPAGINFTAAYGTTSLAPTSISLSSTDNSPLAFTAAPSSSGWLFVSPTSGTTPGSVTVSATPGALAPGTYSGSITIQSSGLPSPLVVPVTLTITSSATLTVTPTSLSFTQVQGGAAPAGQQLSVSASVGSVSFTAASSAAWLTVSPTFASTPTAITVTANGAGLSAGVYNGSVTVTLLGTNTTATIPVTLTVTAPVAVSATPTSLSFTYQTGGATPANQTVSVSATPATAVNFTTAVTMTSGSGWLSATPASGATPGTVTVSVSPASLAAGTYNGTVIITATGASGSPISIPVTLTVQSGPAVTSVVNAASFQSGAVSPGEIITIRGTQMGPATGLNFTINSAGRIDTTLGGVQVLFDNTPAPLLYVSAAQINAIVPYEVAGRSSTVLKVSYAGGTSTGSTLQVAASAPGIFTLNQTGAGQAAVLNQDNSINTASNPAARGSILQVFATGEGQTVPAGITGGITGSTLAKPISPVSVTIGGVSAQVLYAGSAPASVAGLFQVNVMVPNGVQSGNAPIVITVGSVSSQSGATVAIQ